MDRLLDILIRGIVWFARFSKTLARIGIGQYEEWQPGRKMRILLAGNCSADLMSGVLQRLSYLVTSRYHASVLSMRKGCPIVAVSMDERLDGIMKELSLDADYLYSIDDPQLGSHIAASLEKAAAQQHRGRP